VNEFSDGASSNVSYQLLTNLGPFHIDTNYSRELFARTVRANAYYHWREWSGSASKHTDIIFDVHYRFSL